MKHWKLVERVVAYSKTLDLKTILQTVIFFSSWLGGRMQDVGGRWWKVGYRDSELEYKADFSVSQKTFSPSQYSTEHNRTEQNRMIQSLTEQCNTEQYSTEQNGA